MPTNHPITSHNEPGTSSTASSSPSPTSTNHHIREDEELLQQQQQQQEQQAQEEQQRQQLLKLLQIQQLIEANKVRDCQSDDEVQLPNQQHLNNDDAYDHLLNNDRGSHNNITHLNNSNFNDVDTQGNTNNNHDLQNKRPTLSSRNTTSDTTQTSSEHMDDFGCPVVTHKSDLSPAKGAKSSTSTLAKHISTRQQHPYLRNMATLRSKQKFSLDHFDCNRRVFKSSSHWHTNHHQYERPQQSTSTFYNAYLQPNAQFIGEQQSGKSKFRIKVEFKTVDLKNSLVTGFLQINGLTKDHQEIVTYFRGEIINNPLFSQQQQQQQQFASSTSEFNPTHDDEFKRYSFMAENKSWGSSTDNDLDHWQRLTKSPVFPTFPTLPTPQYSTCPYTSTTTIPPYSSSRSKSDEQNKEFMNDLAKIYQGQSTNDKDQHQYIYMRWKEEFLLPDSRVKQIPNASFEGFYYIVLNIGNNQVVNEETLEMEVDADIDGEDSAYAAINCGGIGGSKPGDINGLYYHISSEKFQSLSLSHVNNHGISSTFDFN
ncbi:hypothetical protein CORT_0C03350 [Candida orthopsilosis Co 90-125]|uniref:Uncharacterized protein n=1 Tax=Candida orthopsilosis (strain 90-125) TaxID=1136231 RepID=H8X3S2_CANO9|nr:hypothetical protein CORT_0C03350 [Candida orthopsilosis Co 90-125]CCG25710.1 hypothetical protein CORT_0C03350 [Candida orthopsilosis Co 90-125]